jgi:hypothetical protein
LTARIEFAPGAGGLSVRVLGRLDEPTARQLLDMCSGREGVLIIDIEEMTSADRFAVESLKRLQGAGARLVGASPYIAMLLDGPAPIRRAVVTDAQEEDE